MRRLSPRYLWPLALVLAPGCRQPESSTSDDPLFAFDADQVMVGLQHVLTSDGVRIARLRADTAYFYSARSEIDLRGLELDFFDPSGLVQSVLRARSGVYNPATGDMRAHGAVEVRDASRDRRLETEDLRYDAGQDQLIGTSPFVFYRGGTTTRGSSFEADPAMDNVRTTQSSMVAPGVTIPQ
ncbi:MAG: LPS export ABC transporter periplasmic protein LptC [Gemmatimonadota bacterium]